MMHLSKTSMTISLTEPTAGLLLLADAIPSAITERRCFDLVPTETAMKHRYMHTRVHDFVRYAVSPRTDGFL